MAGHIYGYLADGTPFTNSNDSWRGVEDTVFISHGEWADAEIWYEGHELNSTEVEEYIWGEYKIQCYEEDKQPSSDEFNSLPSEWFKIMLDEYVTNMFYLN